MVHFFKKGHFVDEQTLARVNTAVVLGPIASGWAACVIGALDVYKRQTNLFVGRAADFTEEHVQLFDDVFNRLVAEIEENARFELSSSLARLANAPPRIDVYKRQHW